MKNVSDMRQFLVNELPSWLASQKGLLLDRPTQWINDFSINDDSSSKVKLVKARLERLSSWHRSKYVFNGIESSPDLNDLSVSTRAFILSFLFDIPLYDYYPDNLGYYRIDEYGFLISQTITTGWKDESELVARLGFAELNRLMDRGVTVRRMPWFMLELTKDWLGAGVSLDTEFRLAEMKDLEIWQKLLDGWRNPGESAFDDLMTEMADYHLSQAASASNEGSWNEFEDMSYWLFPVELLAVLRLREWLNIPSVKLTHPLFGVTPLGSLHFPPRQPAHDVLDLAEKKFRSLYPNTPSLADLPKLREKQT